MKMATLKSFLFLFVMVILTVHTSATLPKSGEGNSNNGLFSDVAKPDPDDGMKLMLGGVEESPNKITIVGAGNVGSAVAFSLITQYVTDEIVLIDRKPDLVKGEVQDLQHGTGFLKSPKISGGVDYALSKNSRICIVTAGAKQNPDQSRLSLAQGNIKVFKKIIPQLIEYSPEAVIIIVSNPVDIMTYVAWKLINKPENTHKVIGSGTNLDSSRLRFLISQELKISPESVHGWVIGEHGDSSVTAWSGVNIAGVNLRQLDGALKWKMKVSNGKEGDWFAETHERMRQSAYEIIKQKGYTSWAVGLSVANIVYSILHDVQSIHAVSTMVQGQHGINDEVFLSLPCVLGEGGVTTIIKQPLDPEELEKFRKSANTMVEIINGLNLDEEEENKEGEDKPNA